MALRFFLGAIQEEVALAQLLERCGREDDFKKRDPVIAFRWQPDDGLPIHHRPNLVAHYEQQRMLPSEGSSRGICLVSGDVNVPLAPHETVIKGVARAQTSGANIVSFNERAFESYGKRKRCGENSPIGFGASFAYTTALNHLLRLDSPQKLQIGDATTTFWASRENDLENDFAALFDEPSPDDPDSGTRAVAALKAALEQGVEQVFDNHARFFILGIAPNNARLAIRFWHTATVAEIAQRIARHFDDIRIDPPTNTQKKPPFLSIGLLLRSISPASSKWPDGDPGGVPPNVAGELMRAIIEGLPYPDTLFHGALRRVRAVGVTFPRAAILKACLNRKLTSMEDLIQMSLDPVNANPGYRLGRLFAVLERIQEEAAGGHGKLNATIRDRFYGAASSTPATVFPTLLRLKNHHLSKINNVGRRRNLESLLGEIIDGLPPRFEPHLSMDTQGRFAVGYYHQRMHPSTYGKPGA